MLSEGNSFVHRGLTVQVMVPTPRMGRMPGSLGGEKVAGLTMAEVPLSLLSPFWWPTWTLGISPYVLMAEGDQSQGRTRS